MAVMVAVKLSAEPEAGVGVLLSMNGFGAAG